MKIHPIIVLFFAALALSSCKKENEDPQAFIKEHIVGNWPIKYNIRTTFVDEVEQPHIKGDTLTVYSPIDTLVFTADGQAIRRNKTIISTTGYSIGTDGETITFHTSPALTQKISFVRLTSIGLGSETSSQLDGKTKRVVVADHLIK